MTQFNIDALAGLMREAARAEITPRFRRLGDGDVRIKTDASDLVTEADEAAERYIKERVEGVLPGALFVGEESVAKDPALLPKLAEADLALVVDPIDGTFNFATGIPLFAVMAAVVSKGETVAGIIYDPMGDDWFVAEKGAGAFLKRPDGGSERLQVATSPSLDQMVGTVSITFLPTESKAQVLQNLAKVRVSAHYRVAGHDYRLLTSGHTHFTAYNKVMPWDHLPGALITQEAGGYVARFDGSTYQPGHTSGGLIATTDKDTWNLLRKEVFTV